jgi:hypothetical protein
MSKKQKSSQLPKELSEVTEELKKRNLKFIISSDEKKVISASDNGSKGMGNIKSCDWGPDPPAAGNVAGCKPDVCQK